MTDSLDLLLRTRKYGEALRRIDAGELDPASVPVGIFFAAQAEEPELLKRLLAAGADPNYPCTPRPLQAAVEAGHLANVELLLEAGADPNPRPGIPSPALADAVGGDHEQIARRLIRAGAIETRSRDSLLVRAAGRGQRVTVVAMIEAGFDLDGRATIDQRELRIRPSSAPEAKMLGFFRSLSGRKGLVYANASATVVAAGEGHREVLELLADAGADLSAADDGDVTPWAAAMRSGLEDLADWIESAGGRRQARRGPSDELVRAAEAGDLERLRDAIDAGADVDIRDPRKRTLDRTPLWLAIARGHELVVQALLEAGADVESPDRPDSYPRMREPPTRESLDSEDVRFGLTPLAQAAVLDRTGCADFLLAGGAGREAVDGGGFSCLQLAALNGSLWVLKSLLRAGADPSRSGRGETPLVLAAGDHHTECVTALLRAGADPNATSGTITALHAAIGDHGSLSALLEAGADASVRDVKGKTAFDLAREYIHAGIASIDDAVLERLRQATGSAGGRIVAQPADARREPPELDAELAARYRPEEVSARLVEKAGRPDFVAFVEELAERCGSRPAPAVEGAGYALHVHSVRADAALAGGADVEALQREAAPHGVFILGDRRAGQARELTLLPTTDLLEVIALFGDHGANSGIHHTHILELFRQRPAIITQVTGDTIAGRFEPPPEDPWELTEELAGLRADSFDEGLEEIASELGESGEFYLWWD